jgi:hypothetical protein
MVIRNRPAVTGVVHRSSLIELDTRLACDVTQMRVPGCTRLKMKVRLPTGDPLARGDLGIELAETTQPEACLAVLLERTSGMQNPAE